MYIVRVLPLSKQTRTDVLSYFTPKDLSPGTHIEVPFRNSKIHAIVMDCTDAKEMKGQIKEASYTIKRVHKVYSQSLFSSHFIQSAREIAEHYLIPISQVISDIVPQALFDGTIVSSLEENPTQIKRNHGESLVFQAPLDERVGWYKTHIRESFARKQSVRCIVPTEYDLQFFTQALSKGIEDYTVILHSGLTPKEQKKRIINCLTNLHPLLIISTPGFISLPRNDVSTILLEHESAQAYRLMTNPAIDTRLFIETYARLEKQTLILGDTLLRVETYYRYTQEDFGSVGTILFHPSLPTTEKIIPREKKNEKGIFTSIGDELEKEIRASSKRMANIFLFTLRNGLATITVCRDCKTTLVCEYCNAPLVLYKGTEKRIFMCNTCKRHTPADTACVTCGSWNLFPYGIGIDSVCDEFKKTFPDIPFFRIDRTSITTPKQARTILDSWKKNPGSVLIGTEMALHYIDEPIPTTGVISFDSLFSIPSFRVGERILELITTLRNRTSDSLIIQTIYPNQELLEITSKPKLMRWFESELEDRTLLHYPPQSTLIKIVGHVPKTELLETRTYLEKSFENFTPDIFTGASQQGTNLKKIVALLRVPQASWWLGTLTKGSTHSKKLDEILRGLPEKFNIYINPEDLL